MNKLIFLLTAMLWAIAARSETVYLYSDNGKGGIHRTVAKVVVDEGQYFVDLPRKSYNGKPKTERLKVYRLRDEAYYLYRQPKWAAKYAYVVARPISWSMYEFYYFNMRSKWRPSLTDDPNAPDRVIPVKWIIGYYDNDGVMSRKRLLLIKSNGKYMIYLGDDMFAAMIMKNDTPGISDPAWTRRFRYYTDLRPPRIFFNLN